MHNRRLRESRRPCGNIRLLECTGFRVGNEVREWEEGKLLVFDDTIEHEAWNDSGEDRVILIFDIWRPELNDQERGELAALFAP